MLDTFNGIETVKGMHTEHAHEVFLSRRLDLSASRDEDSQALREAVTQYNQFVNKITTAGLLWFGAAMVLDGGLTLGQLVAINLLNLRFSQPMMRLCLFFYDLSQLRSIVKEVGTILNKPTERQDGHFVRRPDFKGAIRFRNVRFRYPGSARSALEDITFSISPGECLGIIGPSGSGKSTIARLIQRLYSPTSGQILLDGLDAEMVDPDWLRTHVGVTEQDYPIFRRTVAENIALEPTEWNMTRVIRAAQAAHAHEFIARLPRGYSTRIGARGTLLSGGERQRIALARALYHSTSVLILDEATNSLAREDEYRIQHNLEQLKEGRSIIIVAHRLSALRYVDRIISLDQGRIVEEGAPAELVHRSGYFSKLVREQTELVKDFEKRRARNPIPLARAGS